MDESLKTTFASYIVLDRMITNEWIIHSGLLEDDNERLETMIEHLLNNDLITINDKSEYIVSEKGKNLYEKLIDKCLKYKEHFEIYSHVDLEKGSFADKETDLLEDEKYTDLRVAVAKHKGIDPYLMVFLSMLSDGSFFENPDWKFDLAMGVLLDELEEITKDQITIDELAYEDDQGKVSGTTVIEDVIFEAEIINREKQQSEKEAQEKEKQNEKEAEENLTNDYGLVDQDWRYL